MKNLEDMEYFPEQEVLVDTLIKKTQNNNPLFFRILVAYYFSKIASMMRVNLDTQDRGVIPVNTYAINLSVSGSGKGFGTNIMEEKVINRFKERFLNDTYPILAATNIHDLAIQRAPRKNQTVEEVEEALNREFNEMGPLVFGFDSGTSPAVKQMRHKLLLSGAGSINLEIDEIGSNLVGNTEVLNTFLELYDVGKIKQKLIKNTSENRRTEEIDGKTPANMMLYGTPSKLLNGGKTEEEFISMLDTGYARRCLFGYATKVNKLTDLSPEERYKMMKDNSSTQVLDSLSIQLHKLADPINFDTEIEVDDNIGVLLYEYIDMCERRANQMRDFEEIQQAEMNHRYYKALKLAGAYAFIDSCSVMTEDHLYAAIKLVEESGDSFTKILNRPKAPERIARYLADVRKDTTHVEMSEDLPFYRGTLAQRRDLLTQAIAWGYRNNIVIRTTVVDNIELFKGETMDETNLNELVISYSNDIVQNYEAEYAPWDRLHELTTLDGFHYAAHHYEDGYRSTDKMIPGFNLVILDVDSGISLKQARILLKDYKAYFATTKRHTDENNRFRVVLPLSHTVKLQAPQYSKFMSNVFEWLPFEVDIATKDAARKWETYPGDYYYQDGKLLDALLFIPDTNKQQEQHQKVMDHVSMSNLERWLLLNASVGSRSNTLIKYVYVLVDGGKSYDEIKSAVHKFNKQLSTPLTEVELDTTVLVSAQAAVFKRDGKA